VFLVRPSLFVVPPAQPDGAVRVLVACASSRPSEVQLTGESDVSPAAAVLFSFAHSGTIGAGVFSPDSAQVFVWGMPDASNGRGAVSVNITCDVAAESVNQDFTWLGHRIDVVAWNR
jgi:hypothetical protein